MCRGVATPVVKKRSDLAPSSWSLDKCCTHVLVLTDSCTVGVVRRTAVTPVVSVSDTTVPQWQWGDTCKNQDTGIPFFVTLYLVRISACGAPLPVRQSVHVLFFCTAACVGHSSGRHAVQYTSLGNDSMESYQTSLEYLHARKCSKTDFVNQPIDNLNKNMVQIPLSKSIPSVYKVVRYQHMLYADHKPWVVRGWWIRRCIGEAGERPGAGVGRHPMHGGRPRWEQGFFHRLRCGRVGTWWLAGQPAWDPAPLARHWYIGDLYHSGVDGPALLGRWGHTPREAAFCFLTGQIWLVE